MIISRLQGITMKFDEQEKVLEISNQSGHIIIDKKIYLFSLARFLLRVFVKMSQKKRKVKKEEKRGHSIASRFGVLPEAIEKSAEEAF